MVATQKVLLGLDVGNVRVGVAIAQQGFVRPHGIYLRAGNRAQLAILRLIEELKPAEVIVGMPLNEDNSVSTQCAQVEKFARRLARRCGLPCIFQDEYGSSEEAKERLRGIRSPHLPIDDVAAAIILESFLK